MKREVSGGASCSKLQWLPLEVYGSLGSRQESSAGWWPERYEKLHQWGEKEKQLEITSCNLQQSKFTWIFFIFLDLSQTFANKLNVLWERLCRMNFSSERMLIDIHLVLMFKFTPKNIQAQTSNWCILVLLHVKILQNLVDKKENCYLYLDTKQEVFWEIYLNCWCFY